MENKIYLHCPRFINCSVNNCPLTSGYPKWKHLAGDLQRTCTLNKVVRKRIAKGNSKNLKYIGLTPSEFNAINYWKTVEKPREKSPGQIVPVKAPQTKKMAISLCKSELVLKKGTRTQVITKRGCNEKNSGSKQKRRSGLDHNGR